MLPWQITTFWNLVEWVDKVLQQSFEKKKIKFGFKVCEIWPMNYTAMTSSLVQMRFSL
jgi:hypothetical protein